MNSLFLTGQQKQLVCSGVEAKQAVELCRETYKSDEIVASHGFMVRSMLSCEVVNVKICFSCSYLRWNLNPVSSFTSFTASVWAWRLQIHKHSIISDNFQQFLHKLTLALISRYLWRFYAVKQKFIFLPNQHWWLMNWTGDQLLSLLF